MDRRDQMRNVDADTPVRILTTDGDEPADSQAGPSSSPRWFAPVLVAVAVLAAFFFATRPSEDGTTAPTVHPAPIAAIDAALIDLRRTPDQTLTEEWIEQPFAEGATISGVIRASSSFIAFGSNADHAHAWLSGTGHTWRDADRIALPESARSSIDHAVVWNDQIVALGSTTEGVGVWTAEQITAWEYQGAVESMAGARIAGLVAGSELLVIAGNEGENRGWTSSDGVEWRSLGQLPALERTTVNSVTAHDNWFFVTGLEGCTGGSCGGVIYRSQNGTDWELVSGDLGNPAVVRDITATPRGLLALGWIDGHAGRSLAVWESPDGAEWTRIGAGEAALLPTSVVLELVSTTPGDNPVAQISIAGTTYDVTVGTELSTDAGNMTVDEISESAISLSRGDLSLHVTDQITITGNAFGEQIIADGSRVAIAGWIGSGRSPEPAVWLSADGGSTWSRDDLPSTSQFVHRVSTAGLTSIAVGATPSGDTSLWRTGWDAEAAGSAAEQVVVEFLDALNNYDVATVTELLPDSDDGPTPTEVMVPTLGTTAHQWWDADTGVLDTEAVAATLAYLEAGEASIEATECTSSVGLGISDRISVRCRYTADSTLLTAYGAGGGSGEVLATLRSGELVSVTISSGPSPAMWSVIEAGWEEAGATVPVLFDAADAQEHLAAAELMLAGVLAPGRTVTMETVLGTMEWTWTTLDAGEATRLTAVRWSNRGFFATGFESGASGPRSISAWTSPDGVTWQTIQTPADWEWLGEPVPFRDGFVAQAYHADGVDLAYFDGKAWSVIALPEDGSEAVTDIIRLAVADDRILAVTGWWRDDGLLLKDAFVVGLDLEPRLVDLPTDEPATNLQLAGSADGFLLVFAPYNESETALSVWHSDDGDSWSPLAEAIVLEDTHNVWNLQHHGSQYFVTGESAEPHCSTTSEGTFCRSIRTVWRSPEGTDWKTATTQLGGALDIGEIGSGPLGLVAFGQESQDPALPRPVYLSATGDVWSTAGGLSLLNPGAPWWYVGTPAVSDTMVLAAGSSASQVGPDWDEEPFLIIGRLTDE